MKNFKIWLEENITQDRIKNIVLGSLPPSVSINDDIEDKLQIQIKDLSSTWLSEILKMGEVRNFINNPAKEDNIRRMARQGMTVGQLIQQIITGP